MNKVFITKYALTIGILEMEGKIEEDFFTTRQRGYTEVFHSKDFHLNKEDAIKDAEERKIKKLQSLDNQIRKISKLNFNEINRKM